ncbi:TlpA family protein disulfide reductase [Flammeovirga pacifica]|uniref:Thioredoxin domain-containing protein n=1 Tax=Flammeovirga pacifica TaxID=915059 RepID=A0A1S1YW19_FLAPC|nr:TlpA disulfide reductase family protein [Flammeovirga pacifica]OHX65224.1 hypothetical protein NH26_02075 [Flammeovirga pacifica]
MKYYYILFLTTLIFSCSSKENIITYENAISDDLKLVINSTLSHSEIEIPTTREGNSLIYDLPKDAFVTLKDGDIEIEFFAQPKGEIIINRTEDNLFQFEGHLAKYNQSLFDMQSAFDHFIENNPFKEIPKDAIDSISIDLQKQLLGYVGSDLSPHQKKTLESIITIDLAFLNIKHAIQVGYARDESFILKDQFAIENFDLDITEELYRENFNYLSYYIPAYLNVIYLNDDIFQLSGEYYFALRTTEIEKLDIDIRIKRKLLASNISEAITNQGLTDNNEASLYQYLHDYSNFSHKHELVDLLKNNSGMKDGSVAPSIHAFNAEGEIFDLKKHQGKLVYIDVWATWNENSDKQQKQIKKLRSKYKDQNIDFVSLSVDRDQQDWKEYIDYSKQDDVNNIWTSQVDQFYSNYKVYTLPRYILIDQNGKLINSFAPSPDTKEFEELIAEVF